jgi:hypothetical protein
VPPAWAIKDKFSGEDNNDIAAIPSSRFDQSFEKLSRTKIRSHYSRPLKRVGPRSPLPTLRAEHP